MYNLQTAGFSVALGHHHGMKFSTKDKDNDRSLENCAEKFTGAWWFLSCYYVSVGVGIVTYLKLIWRDFCTKYYSVLADFYF